jgi:histidyl-tRNA synthetase
MGILLYTAGRACVCSNPMADKRYRAPRGTNDILPEDQPYWRWLRQAATRVAESYGYRQIETPVFEDAGVFLRPTAGGTDIVDKEIYLFDDRGGERLALRPEGTASVVRAYLEHGMSSWPQPVRLFYIVPIFRYDRPQAGRYRLHHQFGVENIGDASASVDAEVIDLLSSFYDALALVERNLYLNSIGDAVCRPGYLAKLRDYYADKLHLLCGDCRRRFDENPLRLLDCKNEPCQPFKGEAPRFVDNLCEACQAHFEALRAYLKALEIPYEVDSTLVRGLDYYTRTVFEFQPLEGGSQSTIGAGGRYDGLVEQLGGQPTPAAGFGTGIERIVLNLKRQEIGPAPPDPPAVYLAIADADAQGLALRLAHDLRGAGYETVVGSVERSLRAQLRHANTLDARKAVILGKQELAAGKATLRDLRGGSQQDVPLSELAASIGASNQ